MRGSPLLNALIAFIAIALVGIPVLRLTRATGVSAPALQPAAVVAEAKAPIEIAFTTPPQSVRVSHLGKVIWSADVPGTSVEAELAMPWPAEGVDLLVEIAWPDDAPLSAARFVITDPDGEDQMRSIWGRGAKSEVLTFP
ncbi:MAG: hypothetical protein ABMA13_21535 [Chthoniobacteraceae bacterium]